MPASNPSDIRAIIFDLDGTLYVSDEFAATIKYEAAVYMAGVLSVSIREARSAMDETRCRLAGQSDAMPTLSNVCRSLGGKIPALHAHFEKALKPESFLRRNIHVIELLESLASHYDLYIYTNNNRALTTRIMDYLGLEARLFRHVFTIEDSWQPKPDEKTLAGILDFTRLAPANVLFVGDRYEVDLRLPEQLGCPIFLSRNIDQLLRLTRLIPA